VQAGRADLFRLLGDEDRLRLLALCAEEELTVGELASLLGESQPQITKKSQPLREVGLLATRRDGNRTLLRAEAEPVADPVIVAALEEGRTLCTKDGSLARIARVVAQREELSRRLFEQAAAEPTPPPAEASLLSWLPLLAPLVPGRALAIDLGTGEGTLLPLLSAIYERVIAVDRSPSRLARCAARIASWGLPNVRLREGSADDPALAQEVADHLRTPFGSAARSGEAGPGDRGGADLVVMARMLVHASRPQDAIASATRLVRAGGHLAIIDFLPHDDESLREQGHVWLGFEPSKLRTWLEAAKLTPLSLAPFPSDHQPALQLAVAKKNSQAPALPGRAALP
jgi:DNA-binding transcriptional ArsR family regulator